MQARCMDVWCEAIFCGHANFETVFQSASEHAIIFIQRIEKFSGAAPFRNPVPHLEHPPASAHRTLTPSVLNP